MSKFASSPVTRKFRKQQKTCLYNFSGKVVTGVSGGPDSMVLLYLLYRHQIDTTVVHVNYQLRGEASEKDQHLVEEMSSLWEFDSVSVRLDPPAPETGNFQNWARERRYRIFEDIRKEVGAAYILTAHHENDQLETILQKMMRGAGLASWKGMDILEGYLFRPLLKVQKTELMQFAEEFHIPYRIDSSNEESTYARNFIRNNWIPDLDRLFPGWRENLLRIPERAVEFREMAAWIAERMMQNSGRFLRKKFLDLPPAIRPAVFLEIAEMSGMKPNLTRGALRLLNRLETLQTGQKLSLAKHMELFRDREYFILRSPENQTGIRIKLEPEQLGKGMEIDGYRYRITEHTGRYPKDSLRLNSERLRFPLVLRNWEDGDSFQPFGMEGTQLVSDHLANRKISSPQKKKAKVLESFDGTICAVIFPPGSAYEQPGTISEQVRCTQDTRQTVTISKV